MLNLSIYNEEAAMPVLEMYGPSCGHPLMPSAAVPGELSAAARRYGVKPMPALEWAGCRSAPAPFVVSMLDGTRGPTPLHPT